MEKQSVKEIFEKARMGNLNFMMDLSRRVIPSFGNSIFSPAGADVIMAILMGGANGKTRDEFLSTMGFPSIPDGAAESYCSALTRVLPGVGMSNLLLVDGRFSIQEDYERFCRDAMGADVEQASLQGATAVLIINEWMSKNTGGGIHDIVDFIDPMACLVALNAIHFKRGWCVPFGDAIPGRFTNDAGVDVVANMMTKSSNRLLGVLEIEGLCKCAAVPYDVKGGVENDEGSREMMILFLPEEDGPTAVQDCLVELDGETLMSLFDHLIPPSKKNVSITMPKFEIHSAHQSTQISDPLKKMGLASAFTYGGADFTRMIDGVPKGDVYLSRIIQSAHIVVDEQGTEASAGTMGEMVYRSISVGEDKNEIVFDRPFAFMIVDPQVKIPSFVGIVRDPTR